MTTSWERTPISKESYLVERRLPEGRLSHSPQISAPSAQSYRTLFESRPIVLLDRNEAERKRLRKWEIFTCGQDDCLPNQMHFLVKERNKEDHVTRVFPFLSFGFLALRFCLYVHTSIRFMFMLLQAFKA